MSTSDIKDSTRFDVPTLDPDEIEGRVHEILAGSFDEVVGEGEWEWEVQKIDVDEISVEDSLKPSQNAAIEERSRAIARAQLTVGEARPLVVIGENNELVDGHSHLDYLLELDENSAVVYKGTRVD